jgi:hypothetical protein
MIFPLVHWGIPNINEYTTKRLPLDNKVKVCNCRPSQGRNGDLSMSEVFRMASSAEYEPNISSTQEIRANYSSLLVQDEGIVDGFSAAMLLGANFRTASQVASGVLPATHLNNSSENVGPALQLSTSPLPRQFSALTQSRNGSVTPSWAEGVANHATSRI